MTCDRCAAEIPHGSPVACYRTENGTVVVHRFACQCDPEGIKFVQELEKRVADAAALEASPTE